jgi:hypothetical protein
VQKGQVQNQAPAIITADTNYSLIHGSGVVKCNNGAARLAEGKNREKYVKHCWSGNYLICYRQTDISDPQCREIMAKPGAVFSKVT